MRGRFAAIAAVVICGSAFGATSTAQEPSGAGTAPPGAVVETLFDLTLGEDAIPPDLAGVLVFRKQYPASMDIGYSSSFVPPDSFVRYVESGELALRAHSPIVVLRGTTSPPTMEEIPAEVETTVRPGDTFVMQRVPYEAYAQDALGAMWHPGDRDAQVVGFAVRSSDRCCSMTHAGMVSPWHATLSGDRIAAMAGIPVTFRMSRLHLEPGATWSIPTDEPPTMRLVDGGRLLVTAPAQDGGADQVVSYAAGRSFSGADLPPGSILSVEGAEPVTLLELLIEPGDPGDPVVPAGPAR